MHQSKPWLWFSALLMSSTLAICGCTSSPSTAQPPKQPVEKVSIDDLKRNSTTPKYDDLARTPEQYKGKSLSFTGEVIQVAGNSTRPILRVNVTKKQYYWDDTIYVAVQTDVRVLNNDLIQFWGIGQGEQKYETITGSQMRIPRVDAYAVEVVTKAGDRK